MKQWVTAYEQDDPDPAGRDVSLHITAHAYDRYRRKSAHPVTGSILVKDAEPWVGWAGTADVCPECVALMEHEDDIDEDGDATV